MPTTPTIELAAFAVEMILTHGLPMFMATVQTLGTENPSLEQIRALRGAIKDPASYFAQAAKPA